MPSPCYFRPSMRRRPACSCAILGVPRSLPWAGLPHPSRATTPSSWPPRPSSPAPMWCTSGRCRSSSAAGHPTTSGARWWWGPQPTWRPSRSVPPRATRRNPRTWPRRSAPLMSWWPVSGSPRMRRWRSRGCSRCGPSGGRVRRAQSADRAGERSRSGHPPAQGDCTWPI